jgi:hypothetical protein
MMKRNMASRRAQGASGNIWILSFSAWKGYHDGMESREVAGQVMQKQQRTLPNNIDDDDGSVPLFILLTRVTRRPHHLGGSRTRKK